MLPLFVVTLYYRKKFKWGRGNPSVNQRKTANKNYGKPRRWNSRLVQ